MQDRPLSADNYCMRKRKDLADRGASVAEAALVIVLIAIAAAGALSFLGSRSDSSLDEAGKGIHRTQAASGSPGGSPGGGTGGGSTGGSSGPGGGGTPTTAPTATTAPSTTPTTTRPPTTTTTAPPPAPASADLDDAQGVRNGSSRWDASATLQLGADGDPGSMAGTATVQVRWQRSNGQWSTDTIEVPIDADGRALIESGPYARTGSSRINTVVYTVTGIDLHDGREWDGEQPSVSIPRPG